MVLFLGGLGAGIDLHPRWSRGLGGHARGVWCFVGGFCCVTIRNDAGGHSKSKQEAEKVSLEFPPGSLVNRNRWKHFKIWTNCDHNVGWGGSKIAVCGRNPPHYRIWNLPKELSGSLGDENDGMSPGTYSNPFTKLGFRIGGFPTPNWLTCQIPLLGWLEALGRSMHLSSEIWSDLSFKISGFFAETQN